MSNSSKSSYYSESDDDESIEDEMDWAGIIIKNRYIILNKLGAGSYCTVWGTYDIERKQMFALKIYNEEDTDDALHEQEVLDKIKKFNIPNSVLYLDSFKYEYSDDTYIIQIIELCGYSLHYVIKLFVDDLVTDNKLLSDYINFVYNTTKIVINSLNKLHEYNYSHTDIKPENILINIPKLENKIIFEQIKIAHEKNIMLKKKGKIKNILTSLQNDCKQILNNINITQDFIKNYLKDFKFSIKICDYGTALQMGDKTIYKKHTSYYKSPKIILKYPLDKTYDFWSLGCTLYELITGNILFDPFDNEIEDKFGENEDRNLIYLITCSIGIPNTNILNNSKLADVFFTSDRECIRGYNEIQFNPFINNLIEYQKYIDQNDTNTINKLLELTYIISQYISYNSLF